MAYLQYEGVGITALSAAVPKRIIANREYTEVFTKEEVAEIVDKTGIEQRRFADQNTCSSDLCLAAAERLIADNDINKEDHRFRYQFGLLGIPLWSFRYLWDDGAE